MKIYKLEVKFMGVTKYSYNRIEPLYVGLQKTNPFPYVWAEVEDEKEEPVRDYFFKVYMTGEAVDPDLIYCGTFQLREPGQVEFVGHIYMGVAYK